MPMKRTDLYELLGMRENFHGDSFEYEIGSGRSLSGDDAIVKLLDEICVLEELNPLKEGWNKIDFEKGSKQLMNALRFDLAYSTAENMPPEKAQHFHQQILARFNNTDCTCYSNWSKTLWEENPEAGIGWDPLTDATFDMAIVFVDNMKVVFTYFTAED